MLIHVLRLLLIAGMIAALATLPTIGGRSFAAADGDLARIVNMQIRSVLGEVGGIAVAVRANGRTSFFNFGMAGRNRPVTSDALFNLGSVGKVFDATLLALADQQNELRLDDPVAKYVAELQMGGDIRRVTLRQLATYTSGLVLPQDHPPWPSPEQSFTLPQFLALLNGWAADPQHEPGKQMIYSHAGYVLLHLALERRFALPFGELMEQRVLKPLGLRSTTLPVASADMEQNPRGEIPQVLVRRTVQGYSRDGAPFGVPGDLEGYYHWLGTGQMYGSARDIALFLKANLGEFSDQAVLQEAMRSAQQASFPIHNGLDQGLAWEIHTDEETIVDKFGGLYNASAYIGFIPRQKIGIVILRSRGGSDIAGTGRNIILALARHFRIGAAVNADERAMLP